MAGGSEPKLGKEGIHAEGVRNWHPGLGLEQGKRVPGQSGSPRNIRTSLRSACLVLVDELKQRQETVPAEQDLGGSARNQAEGTKGTQ